MPAPCRVALGIEYTIRLTILSAHRTINRMVDDQNLDDVFHALADPTRRAMLRNLSRSQHTVGELASPFSITLAAASKHIKVLERAGLVRRRIEGRTHICSLDAGPCTPAWNGSGTTRNTGTSASTFSKACSKPMPPPTGGQNRRKESRPAEREEAMNAFGELIARTRCASSGCCRPDRPCLGLLHGCRQAPPAGWAAASWSPSPAAASRSSFQNADLSDKDDPPPAKYAGGDGKGSMPASRRLRAAASSRLSLGPWRRRAVGGPLELEERGDKVLLTLTHGGCRRATGCSASRPAGTPISTSSPRGSPARNPGLLAHHTELETIYEKRLPSLPADLPPSAAPRASAAMTLAAASLPATIAPST